MDPGFHAGMRDGVFRGLRIQELARFTDRRGTLSVLEHARDLGFVARRAFFIDFADESPRAEHAPSCTQLIMVLSGALRMDLDNGADRTSIEGRPAGPGFLLAAGVWRRLLPLEPDTSLMVLADTTYAETRYFDTARPELIAEAAGWRER